jgi:coatomer protein complex subunit gamma
VLAVEYSPFYGIEKGAVLQEARIFHDPNLDPRRCSQVRKPSVWFSTGVWALAPCHNGLLLLQVITKLLYMLNQGETFTKV